MTPEQEDELRSMVQGVEDRVRDVESALEAQTGLLGQSLDTAIGVLIDIETSLGKLREDVKSLTTSSQSKLF